MDSACFRQTKRISFPEGVKMLSCASLEELKDEAMRIRNSLHPGNIVTYVLDSNPNYTNRCDISCSFCAFSKKEGGYFKSVDEVMEHFRFARKNSLNTVLLQGGINSHLTLDYFSSLVKRAQKEFSEIHPHFFSAQEIDACAKNSNVSVEEVLQTLFDLGLRTIPGGGAEILCDSVRKKISPKKISAERWLFIHEIAHKIGYKTTATMMFGHIETIEERVIHLDKLRALQDKTLGFLSFIPWSYKPKNNALGRIVKEKASEESYLRLLAFSRIYLDNFPHIGASWFSEGKETGVKALNCGADDFGGCVMEETVHKDAGWENQSNQKEMIAMIEKAKFTARMRNSFYELL